MRILTVGEIQSIERSADALGHTYAAMMALAGKGVAEAIRRRLPVVGKRILVLVGPGNNGGDGLVAARWLQESGAAVTAYLSRTRDQDEDAVYRDAVTSNVPIVNGPSDVNAKRLRSLLAQTDVIVDALLGTGATPPLRGAIADILSVVHQAVGQPSPQTLVSFRLPHPQPPRPCIVAVDGPSGLDFDTGEVDANTLRADFTVTFAAPKWGHLRFPGAARVGDLVVADIGIPDSVEIPVGPKLATPNQTGAWLPPRPMDAHKGTFGKAMIVAGSSNYTGAAILAATAAVRAGTGLVTLALPGTLHSAVVAAIPEATYLLLPHALGVVNEHAVPVLMEAVPGYSAMLVGPGLGHTPETRAFLTRLLGIDGPARTAGFLRSEPTSVASTKLPPLVVDADGLNILSEIPNWPAHLPTGTILTPHPGEMARLTGVETSEIQDNRLDIAQEWAQRWQQVVVLKGAFTIIASPEHEPVLLPFANPGLSSAGTGDVLAGTIVALRAQGLEPFRSAVAGAYLHGLAGEIATRRRGAAGTAASDVALALAAAWQQLTATG